MTPLPAEWRNVSPFFCTAPRGRRSDYPGPAIRWGPHEPLSYDQACGRSGTAPFKVPRLLGRFSFTSAGLAVVTPNQIYSITARSWVLTATRLSSLPRLQLGRALF